MCACVIRERKGGRERETDGKFEEHWTVGGRVMSERLEVGKLGPNYEGPFPDQRV